jgi:6-phosphogluconate dehydrogenase
MKYTIGVAGLGVMGFNLALNIERNGFPVVGYDLDPKKSETFQKTAGKRERKLLRSGHSPIWQPPLGVYL